MAFDDELRAYLEGLETRAPTPQTKYREVDPEELRFHLLRRLHERATDPVFVEQAFHTWSPRLVQLARYIEQLPSKRASEDVAAFAALVLDAGLKIVDDSIALVDRLEFARIADAFERGDANVATYAMENHLTRREVDGSVRTTPLSRVFLRLRGKDAVRWLLAIEVRCNRGIADPWHCSTDLLEDSVSDDGIEKYLDDGEDQFLFSQRTISRLLALDVLRPWLRGPDFELYRYTVAEEMRDVVAAVIGGGPWSSAVAALIEDERALVVGGTGGAASDATIDQTRMIAHEVRNALVPARHHLDALLATATEPGRERVEATRRGVVRVLGFVDELIATSELIEEPATTLALSSVIAEAIGGIEGGDRVTVDGSVARITLRAPRTRLARALVNVILNAVQATTPAQVIRVSARRTVDRIEIAVDDAGPGVAEPDRARVFDDGFTTRPGGSGFGLAFVRNVVETRFRGTVRCEASDLGGARFVIAIPEVPTP